MITFIKTFNSEAIAYNEMKQLFHKLEEYENVTFVAKGYRKANVINIHITIKIN